MAEDGGRHDHFGMIAALENFQVGAAGQRGLDADADFAGVQWRRREVFNANVSFPCRMAAFTGAG